MSAKYDFSRWDTSKLGSDLKRASSATDSLREMTERLSGPSNKILRDFQSTKFANLFGSRDAQTVLGAAAGLSPALGAAASFSRMHELFDSPLSRIIGGNAFGPDFGHSWSADFAALERANSLLPSWVSAQWSWSKHLSEVLSPSMKFLAMTRPTPTALLTNAESGVGASVMWTREGRDGPQVVVATVVDISDRRFTPFEVETVIRCRTCGTEILDAETQRKWVGRKLLLEYAVSPVCRECIRGQDPESSPEGPRFRLIRGSGEGDGKPSGAVRLVPVLDD